MGDFRDFTIFRGLAFQGLFEDLKRLKAGEYDFLADFSGDSTTFGTLNGDVCLSSCLLF